MVSANGSKCTLGSRVYDAATGLLTSTVAPDANSAHFPHPPSFLVSSSHALETRETSDFALTLTPSPHPPEADNFSGRQPSAGEPTLRYVCTVCDDD